MNPHSPTDQPATRKRPNIRTAAVLLLIAAVFFAGVIFNRWLIG